jgi:hypothetical protein
LFPSVDMASLVVISYLNSSRERKGRCTKRAKFWDSNFISVWDNGDLSLNGVVDGVPGGDKSDSSASISISE